MFSVGVLLFAASVFAAPAALPSCLEQPGPIVSIVTSFASSAGYVSSAVPTNGPATSSTYRSSSSSMASQSDSSTSVSGSSMSPVTSKAQVTSPSSSSSAGLAATTAVPTIMFLQKIGPGTIPYSGSLTDGCIYALLTPSLFENAHDQECGPQDPAARYGRYFNFTSRNLTLRIGSVNGSFAFEVGYVASARREVSNDPRSWVFLYGANAPSAVTASQTGSSQTSTATTATNVSLYVSSSASSTTLVSSSSSDVASATFSAWSSAASSPIPSTNSLSTGVSSAAITVTSGTFTSLTSSSSVDSLTFSVQKPTTTVSTATKSSMNIPQTTYSISLPSCVPVGSKIVVNWVSPASSGSKDWIGIYPASKCDTDVGGQCQTGSSGYSYVQGGSTSGTVSISSIDAGTYAAFYLLNDGYKIAAISVPFTVAINCGSSSTTVVPTSSITSSTNLPSIYSLSKIPACVTPGTLIVIDWMSGKAAGTKDWLGVYPTGSCGSVGSACSSGSSAWTYVHASTLQTGRDTITAPGIGSYAVYYLLNDGYTIAAVSVTFVVAESCTNSIGKLPTCLTPGSNISVPWTAAVPGAGTGDVIALFPSGSCKEQVCVGKSPAFVPVNVNNQDLLPLNGTTILAITQDLTGQVYNAFYLPNGNQHYTAFSNQFTIQPSCDTSVVPNLSAPATAVVGGFIQITWTGASAASTDDWILFTQTNSTPSASTYLSDCWQYTYRDTIKTGEFSKVSGSVSVKAPAIPGTYKAWYCLNSGFNCKASVSVIVTKPQFSCRAAGNTASNIKNVIIIVSENHSFDSYFGRYCKASFGSKPSCNTGPDCCEAYNPISGVEPTLLNDAENVSFDPDHSTSGEICRMNGGLMDKFVTGCSTSNPKNFAMADGSVGSANQYWGWASNYAMSDRFFQSSPGASCQNDMYFARGAYVFLDNSKYPGSGGAAGPCPSPYSGAACATYNDPTIGDLLQDCNVPFAWYQVAYPNIDVSDDPFLYYPSLANGPNKDSMFKEFNQLAVDISSGNLPSVTFIKGGYSPASSGVFQDTSEHPGNSISGGEKLNAAVIDHILASDMYKDNTVVFLVPDESGGFRDSMTPPTRSAVDNKLYGPRTQFLAVGNMVKKNYISHVSTEPASIIRFIESNWLGDAVPGQLQTRDAVAGSLNDMFDQAKTGFVFP